MSDLNVVQQPLPMYEPSLNSSSAAVQTFGQINSNIIKVGAIPNVVYIDKTGAYFGGVSADSANARILSDGTFSFKNAGGEVIVDNTGLGAGSTSNLISIQGWSFSGTFSATDADTVAWTSGLINLADGTNFSIASGDTGNISAINYIYFDKSVSTTVLQVTTTASTAVGANKILMCVAKNETGKSATFQAFGGKGVGVLITADNIAANSITSNEIASNTITANNIKTGELVVGTNVAQGSAVTSSNVTTIIGNTVTTGYVNALSITAGSVAAENISGNTITGKVVRTSADGSRVQLNSSTQKLECFDGGGSVQGALWGGGSDFYIYARDNIKFYANSGGNHVLSIGTTRLTPYQADTFDLGTTSLYWGTVCSNHFNDISDRKLKKNIKTIESALDKVMQLRGVSFNWKKKAGPAKRQIGMIAQEVEKVLPEVVNIPEDKDGNYTICYGKIVGLLVEAIKDQQKQIDFLTARLH